MSLDQNSAAIDIDTNEPFCFLIPQSTMQSCQLNTVHILQAPSKVSVLMMNNSREISLRINDWNSVNLLNGEKNVLRCDAGVPRTRAIYHTNFYSLSKYHLNLFHSVNLFFYLSSNVSKIKHIYNPTLYICNI